MFFQEYPVREIRDHAKNLRGRKSPPNARLTSLFAPGTPPAGLRGAIFAYNHATWYVNEVLALAASYAADYH